MMGHYDTGKAEKSEKDTQREPPLGSTMIDGQQITASESGSNLGLNKQRSNSWTGWSLEEKRALAAVTFPLIEMQKAYGREMNAKLLMQGWEIKFAGRFTIEQILYALDKYTDKRDDFPSPANLIEILEPEEPKVTESQFISAQKWQERNNDWSQYTEAAETISRYRRQNEEKREMFQITCEKVKQLAASSVRRINQIAFDNQPQPQTEEANNADQNDFDSGESQHHAHAVL